MKRWGRRAAVVLLGLFAVDFLRLLWRGPLTYEMVGLMILLGLGFVATAGLSQMPGAVWFWLWWSGRR